MQALIGDIGRCAIHDGPGIRTTVFFKGCPLHCPWCHNPEFMSPVPEVLYYADRCLGCGDCAAACPEDAIAVHAFGAAIDRQACSGCGQCADVCPARAMVLAGQPYTVAELVELLLRDRLFYEASGGGVTLSGGEPTAQMDFLEALLTALRKANIHTVLETNGFFDFEDFAEKCLDLIDLIYFDIKIADGKSHRDATGKHNQRIWTNLARIQERRPGLATPRIPIIPGFTATEDNIRNIAVRLHALGFRQFDLLPYHPYGRSKAASLGKRADHRLPDNPMAAGELSRWQKTMRRATATARGDKAASQGHAAHQPINREVKHAN